MNEIIRKLAPTFLVGAIFSWFCWPYLSGTATNTSVPPASESPGLPNSLLSPKLKAANDRNPFQAVEAVVNLMHGLQQGARGAAGKTSDSGATGAAAGPSAGEPSAAKTPTLALGGTFIQGDRRMAIINGKVYALGETLKEPGAESNGGKVTTILADKALVQWGGKTLEATYPKPDKPRVAASEKPDDETAPPTSAPAAAPAGGVPDVPASVSELLRQLQALQQ